jgi:hypothetical protein
MKYGGFGDLNMTKQNETTHLPCFIDRYKNSFILFLVVLLLVNSLHVMVMWHIAIKLPTIESVKW